jgi:uncharacterized Zn-binding protein involved in type VI secretion
MGSKGVTRLGDKTTGHGPWLPRASNSASADVKADGIGVVRKEDTWDPHNGIPNGPHKTAIGVGDGGSSTVFANNKAVARIGDSVEADKIAGGSGTVFAGD